MASAKSQGLRLIENRRKAENAYNDMQVAVNSDRKTHLVANFEINTAAKIDKRMKQTMYEEKKRSYDENLAMRRRRLADLYNDEMDAWKQEVLAKVETQEDRKARIMAKAYALRDAREAERQNLVTQKLNDQWRDSCDDARTLDSKAMVKFMSDERIRQIKEKQERRQKLSAQEDAFLEEWNKQLDAVARKEMEKEENRRRIDKETSFAIKQQMENNERMKENYYRNLRREEEAELERLRLEIEADERLQRERIEQAHARGRDVVQFNQANRAVRVEEEAVEREHDAILLDYALRKERATIAAEEYKKNADKQAALQYRKYLEEQMVKEAEDTAFVDEIRKREEEKVWKARDDALQAREDARAYLLKMVDEGRQEQIRYKEEQSRKEVEEESKFVKRFMDEDAEAVRRDRDAVIARQRQAVQNNAELQRQIDARRMKEELVKQEEYLADKQMQYRERMHQQRLAEQAGSIRLNFPQKKSQWYS